MIAMGKESQVLNWLLAHLDGQPKDVRRQITIQSNRFQKLKRKRLEGSIDRNSANVESSQISGILLEILDSYDFEREKKDKIDSPEKANVTARQPGKSPRLASVGMLLLGISLLSASGLLIWNLLGNNTGTEGSEVEALTYVAEDWEGAWEVDFVSGGKDRKAHLLLERESGNWRGRVNILAEGADASYDLLLENIKVEEGYHLLTGSWQTEQNFIPAMNGTFRLGLKGEGTAFEGYFRNSDGRGQQNSWKGKRK